MTFQRRRCARPALLSAAAATAAGLLIQAGPAGAAPTNWQGGVATAPHWSQGGNWNPSEPTSGDDAIFPAVVPAPPGATISLATDEFANTITLNGNYTLGVAANDSGLTLTTGTSSITLGPSVVAVINSTLKGSNGISVGVSSGTATLTLNGTNTFTGGLTINTGATVQIAGVGASPSADTQLGPAAGAVTINGGTLKTTHTSGQLNMSSGRTITIGSSGATIITSGGAASGSSATTAGKLLFNASNLAGSGTITRPNGGAVVQMGVNQPNFSGAWINRGLTEVSTSNALGDGSATNTVNVDTGGEIGIGNGATAVPQNFTMTDSLNGTDPMISSIGGGGARITGTLTANSPFTIALRAFNSSSTGNSLTLAGNLSGSGVMTLIGPTTPSGQTLFLNGANNSGFSSNISVPAGLNLSLGVVGSATGGTVTINTDTTRMAGFGVGYDPGAGGTLPTFTNTRTGGATTGGVFLVNSAAFATVIDQSTLGGGGMFLGSSSAGSYTASSLTPHSGNYRLGGGGGTLTVSTAVLLGAGNNLVVGDARGNGGGTVILGSLANTFDGTVTINQGVLQVADVASSGANSPIGSGASAIALGSTTAATFRFTGAGADSTNRAFTVGSGGATFDINQAAGNLTIGALTGTGGITKIGVGTLTLGNGGANAVTTLTVPPSASSQGTIAIPVNTTLTLNGGGTGNVLLIGSTGTNDSGATVTVSGAGTFAINNTAGDVYVGVIDDDATVPLATLDMTNLGTFTASVDEFKVGDNQSGTNRVRAAVTLGGTNTITANALRVGTTASSEAQTGMFLRLGQTNTINTDAIAVGGGRNAGDLSFRAGLSGTPTIMIRGKAAGADPLVAANRADLTIGDQTAATGGGSTDAAASTVNFTAGSVDAWFKNVLVGVGATSGSGSDGSGNGTLSFDEGTVTATSIVLGRVKANADASTTANGTTLGTLTMGGGTLTTAGLVLGDNQDSATGPSLQSSGVFNLSGGQATVNANVVLGQHSGDSTGEARGTINLSGNGILTINGTLGEGSTVSGAGANVSTLALSNTAILNMAGNNITAIDTLTFTGGTMRNVGSLAQTLTENGASAILDVLANDTTINGSYVLTAGTTSVKPARTLDVNGTLDLTSAADTLRINDDTGLALDGVTTYTLVTFDTLASSAHYDAVTYFNGTTTLGPFTDAQATTPGALPNSYVVQYNANSITLTPVPEPAGLGALLLGGIAVTGRRRQRRAAVRR